MAINKKVLKTMIILVIVYLLVWYILKFAIPEKFIFAISSEPILSFGHYVDTHTWADVSCAIISQCISYFLFICAVCKQKYLTVGQWWFILIAIMFSVAFDYVLVDFLVVYNMLVMFGLALLFKADFKTTYIVYTIHIISQYLSLQIRQMTTRLTDFNYASVFLLTIECYFWLLLFYLYNNYKEVKNNG